MGAPERRKTRPISRKSSMSRRSRSSATASGSASRTTTRAHALLQARGRQRGNALPACPPRGARRLSPGSAQTCGTGRCAAACAARPVRTGSGQQGDVDHHGDGADVDRAPERQALGPRIVPIVADEARTFGMASLFRQVGIYAPQGSCTSRKMRVRSCTTARTSAVRFSKRASPKRAPSRRGSQPARPTARTAWRCCRSISTTRCLASSASAI